MTPDQVRERAVFFRTAKAEALAQLGPLGPRSTVELFLKLLRAHPDLARQDQHFALSFLDATQAGAVLGSAAARDWIEAYPWPGRLESASEG